MISREISFIGNLVGTYVDLQDLMTLTAQGKVTLHTSTYPLDAINDAMADLDNGRLQGRGILVPTAPRRRRHGMGKRLYFNHEARRLLQAGVDELANTVKVTLGPEGPQRRARAADRRADDHQRRRLDRARDRALRPVQEHGRAARPRGRQQDVSDLTGDGTTTATLLAQAIVREGMRALDEGANPMLLRRGIEEATARSSRELQRIARPVEGREQLEHIATIAAKEDEVIGEAVADALDRVGAEGVVTDRGVRRCPASRSTSSRA